MFWPGWLRRRVHNRTDEVVSDLQNVRATLGKRVADLEQGLKDRAKEKESEAT